MIEDKDTNIVYLSKWIKSYYGHFYQELSSLFEELGIEHRLLEGTEDYWCRDFMPIQISKDRFIGYKYKPDYLQDKPTYITDCSKVCGVLGIDYDDTDIILDGGNVVYCGNCVVMTDKIFSENGVNPYDKLFVAKLESYFGLKVVFIPWVLHEKEKDPDVYGHSDGFIKYMSDNKILMSNHRECYSDEADNIRRVLEDNGFEITELKFHSKKPNTKLNWAYINFLQIGSYIIMPRFDIEEDEQAINQIGKAFPECSIHTIEMSTLAKKGGALHCLTWNIIQ